MSHLYVSEPITKGKVLLSTTLGDVEIELWSKEAPKACRNFVQLCLEGYYDGCIFHRVVRNFIAQTGDPTGTGEGGESVYGAPFEDEFHSRLKFTVRGRVAMANDGEKDTNRSQFFITLERADELNGKYTIFGKVGGDTIYNVLRFNDLELDGERPVDPPKILRTEVIYNPFDDIFPRAQLPVHKLQALREKQRIEEERKRAEKAEAERARIHNASLLSFSDDTAEEADGPAIKIKSLAELTRREKSLPAAMDSGDSITTTAPASLPSMDSLKQKISAAAARLLDERAEQENESDTETRDMPPPRTTENAQMAVATHTTATSTSTTSPTPTTPLTPANIPAASTGPDLRSFEEKMRQRILEKKRKLEQLKAPTASTSTATVTATTTATASPPPASSPPSADSPPAEPESKRRKKDDLPIAAGLGLTKLRFKETARVAPSAVPGAAAIRADEVYMTPLEQRRQKMINQTARRQAITGRRTVDKDDVLQRLEKFRASLRQTTEAKTEPNGGHAAAAESEGDDVAAGDWRAHRLQFRKHYMEAEQDTEEDGYEVYDPLVEKQKHHQPDKRKEGKKWEKAK